MRTLLVLALLAGLTLIGLAKPASAQNIPNVRGLTPFTAETNFMSLAGWLRWQYHIENSRWISRTEAVNFVKSQTGATAAAATTPTK